MRGYRYGEKLINENKKAGPNAEMGLGELCKMFQVTDLVPGVILLNSVVHEPGGELGLSRHWRHCGIGDIFREIPWHWSLSPIKQCTFYAFCQERQDMGIELGVNLCY